jgi:hypothetical protein
MNEFKPPGIDAKKTTECVYTVGKIEDLGKKEMIEKIRKLWRSYHLNEIDVTDFTNGLYDILGDPLKVVDPDFQLDDNGNISYNPLTDKDLDQWKDWNDE